MIRDNCFSKTMISQIVILSFFVLALFSALIGCGSIGINAEPACTGSGIDPEAYIIDYRGKFCNNDTYIIKAAGVPGKKSVSSDERKGSARINAVLEAQYKLLEVFMGDRIETWSPMYEPPQEYVKGYALWKKDVIAIVKNGTVLAESFDSEQNCTILYIIQKKNLRELKEIPFEKYTGDME